MRTIMRAPNDEICSVAVGAVSVSRDVDGVFRVPDEAVAAFQARGFTAEGPEADAEGADVNEPGAVVDVPPLDSAGDAPAPTALELAKATAYTEAIAAGFSETEAREIAESTTLAPE